MTDLMISWTRRNPEIASEWVERSGEISQPLLAAVGRTWAESDPSAAVEWAVGLSAGAARRSALLAVTGEYARQDPEEAADALASALVDSEPGALDLATVIADVWATMDPEATALWVSQMQVGVVRDQAAGVLATVWGSRDMESAVNWASAIGDEGMRRQVIAHLGTTWGALDPAAAVEWLGSLDPSEAEAGLVGALNSWAAVDPIGIRGWIENSAATSFSDPARRSLADVLSQGNVMGAMEVAVGIADEQARADALARYFRLWRKTDDASAQEWLAANWDLFNPTSQKRLSDIQRQTFLNP